MEFNPIPIFSEALLKNQSTMELMACNEKTAQYQLQLSKEDAVFLIDTRNDVLKMTDRLEIGGGIIKKLILAFEDSPYISQEHYAVTISELIETFYYYKNETLEEISDDDLIDLMKELFDDRCHGGIELLQGRDLERIAREIRYDIRPSELNGQMQSEEEEMEDEDEDE